MRALTFVRAIVGDAAVVAITVLMSPFVVTAGALGKRRAADALILFWGRFVLAVYGSDVRLTGAENFSAGTGCLLLFNHQSLLDIPVLYGTLRRTVRFGAKTELFRIPFFGPAMKSVGTLPIARANRTETLSTYKNAEAMFARGFSYALAPEGTRQRSASIGSFKAGPFIFAVGAQAPIVPTLIKGVHEVLPKDSLFPNLGAWRRTVDLQLLPPIPTRGLGPNDVGALMERVRSAMVEAFERIPERS